MGPNSRDEGIQSGVCDVARVLGSDYVTHWSMGWLETKERSYVWEVCGSTNRYMFIDTSKEGISTCRSKIPNDELTVEVCLGKSQERRSGRRLRVKTTQRGYVFWWTEIQALREPKMPKKPCQDSVVANCQEKAMLKELKKRRKCLMKEDGWRRR